MNTEEPKQLTFGEMLEQTRDKINWKISVHDATTLVFRQMGQTFFEELPLKAQKMEVRQLWELATPNTINSLVAALTEDSERLFDDTLFLESRKRCIGFLNGVFDLQTGKVRKYQPGDFVLQPLPHKIPFKVSKDAEKWLLKILQSWVGKEVGDWFLSLLAYVLFQFPNTEDLWLNLFGTGSNGKSVCLDLLQQILGKEKCIGCDLKHINRFSGDTFKDKWLVVGRDSSDHVSDKATAFIKTYTGDRMLLVEVKGGGSWDIENPGKMIVSTNGLISSRDRSYGWYRRLIPVEFPNLFPRNERFKQDLFGRLPDIIRVLLHRAYLYKKSATTLEGGAPRPVEDLRREVRISCDRVAAFWESYFYWQREEGGPFVLNKEAMNGVDGMRMQDLYQEYCEWHQSEFGSAQIEPSLNRFGGVYGAFLSGDAKHYYTTKRTNRGRILQLKEGTYFE